MIKKIISFMFVFAFIIAVSNYVAPKAQAAVYPDGCSSAIGYSITDGNPCNGTSTATAQIAGCATVLGYSVTTGTACSGGSEALTYLAGCTSTYGYSTITSAPCNGTQTAYLYVNPIVTPGLPTTGVMSLSLINIVLLGLLGVVAIGGITYANRQTKKA